MLSLVIPTYNEAEVVQETLRRVAEALQNSGESFELIVVDDSSADGTAARAEALAERLPVRVLRRPGRLGLATAVLDGWAQARGDLLGVMDADLQHPPEVIVKLLTALRSTGADLAVASRYRSGGGTSEWTWLRRFISWGATHLAASFLPLTLAGVSDPMSGMFLVRAATLDSVRLNPVGYKILLEVLAKAHYRGRVEVPYIFETRGHGRSKLGARQYGEFLLHLARLSVATGELGIAARYVLGGMAGAIVNVSTAYGLATHAGWPLPGADAVAIELALLWNFIWDHGVTFRPAVLPERMKVTVSRRLLRYEKACGMGALVNFASCLMLYSWKANFLPAILVGVVAGSAWNILFRIPTIWRIWYAGRETERTAEL